jgi:hypothetical protein
MKTEWMYFMAGAGLMAAVMSFNMNESSPADCTAVARAIAYNEMKGLTTHEKEIIPKVRELVGEKTYSNTYLGCLVLERTGL